MSICEVMAMTDLIVALSAVFIAAGIFLIVANHFGLPPVPFYIIAGLSIGLGGLVDEVILLDLALWGVAFLVFVFGIHVDLGDIQLVLRDGEGAAFTQLVLVAPFALGVGYLFASAAGLEDPSRNALYFGAAATLSSTLVGARILQDEIRNNLVYGRLAASIHFFDDIVAIGAIVILSAEPLTDTQLLTSKIGFAVLFLLAGLLIYRHGYPLLIRVADGGDELILMGSISILIVFIAAAEAVGVSLVVGAFAAGLAVRSEGVESLGVQNGIESIKDFFAAIFFVTVGALVALPSLTVLGLAGVLIGLVFMVNPLVHTAAFVYEGYDGRTAFFAGSSLNQVSELALVIAIQARLDRGTIADPMFDAIILAAAVTMIGSAFGGRYEFAIYNRWLAPILERREDSIEDRSNVGELTNHVVIIGYGRQGRHLRSVLEELDEEYVVIDNDPAILDDLERDCEHYVFGDAMAQYPMTLARVDSARLVVSTVDHRPVSDALLATETDGDVIVRADTSQEAFELLEEGARFVSVPGILAGAQLVENLRQLLSGECDEESLEADHRQYLKMVEMAKIETRLDQSQRSIE